MTLTEFEATRETLSCRLCGQTGLVSVPNPNNEGVRAGCPACGCSNPIPGVQWLKKQSAESRRLRRPSGDPRTEEVWAANGDTCAYCGKTRAECEEIEIGITVQHVVPVSQGGEKGVLIPFCARCQQGSVAALAETQRWRHRFEDLKETIARLREKQHVLDRERGLR